MSWYIPSAHYSIVVLEEDFAVEFDCTDILGVVNYCVHFLASTPNVDVSKLQPYIEYVNQLNLNYENLDLQVTKQEGCW
jgi:hypothetical protein